MRRYDDSVANKSGMPVFRAQVRVFTQNPDRSIGAPATLYSDNGNTVASQPLYTDALGAFYFYVADGAYTLTIAGNGLTTVTIPDVQIYEGQSAALSVKVAQGFTPPQVEPGTSPGGKTLVFDVTGTRLIATEPSAVNVVASLGGSLTVAPAQKTVTDAISAVAATASQVSQALWSNIYVTPTVVFGDLDQGPSLENFQVQVDRNGNLAEISIRFTARDKTGPDANTPPSGQLRITGLGVANNGIPKEMQMRESGLPDGAYALFDGDTIGFWIGDAPAEAVTADMIDGPYWVRMTQTTTVLPPEETA
jgi:hypothetical protein